MPALLHLDSHGAVVALHVTGPTKREIELDELDVAAILSSLVPMASQIFLFFLFLFLFFSCQRNQIDKSAILHSKFATMTFVNCYVLWIGIPY
jgi:hypothetical protein